MKPLLIALIVFSTISLSCEAENPDESTLYDANPKHLWNRLNQTLFERTAFDGKHYGLDELDILYWARTTHLLTEPSHQKALAVLDEFINSHGEKLISDPLKRAILQRDLWELFDWSTLEFRPTEDTRRAQRELQTRIGAILRRIALTTNEIQMLPDNYARAAKNASLTNLPQNLLQSNSDWVYVGRGIGEPTAIAHVRGTGGHSAFFVMFHHPYGQQAATNYLAQLASFKNVWAYGTNQSQSFQASGSPILNPELPQFPPGSEWALVRRMCIIDTQGQIQATPIVESIQIRRYEDIQPLKGKIPTLADEYKNIASQKFLEFRMDHSYDVALRVIATGEKDFEVVPYASIGMDPFERERNTQSGSDSSLMKGNVLESCGQCHGSPGLGSVNTFTRLFASEPSFTAIPLREIKPESEISETIFWKHQQYSWGLLQGLWTRQE